MLSRVLSPQDTRRRVDTHRGGGGVAGQAPDAVARHFAKLARRVHAVERVGRIGAHVLLQDLVAARVLQSRLRQVNVSELSCSTIVSKSINSILHSKSQLTISSLK